MFSRKSKAKRWVRRQIKRNLKTKAPINAENYIHKDDKAALETLKKIPLLSKLCKKIISVLGETQRKIFDMSSKVHITEEQLPKIYKMVESICKKIGIEMPDLYLELDRLPNAYVYGWEKFTLVITSGLIECLEEDEIYAVLAHECGHIACEHGLYYTVASIVFGTGSIGLNEAGKLLSTTGIIGTVVGGIVSLVDNALELALYHWNRCSELSADRIAAICCGGVEPVVNVMMRLAGGTTHIDSEINKDLFAAQAEEYKRLTSENKINKALEFFITKNYTHPLLAVRAYELQQFANSEKIENL